MVTRDERRAQLVPEVARKLRGRDFRSDFTEHFGQARAHTIIVVLPDDSVGYALQRLGQAGGHGVLAMPQDDELKIALLSPVPTVNMAE